jgi:hypothetical protein
MIQSTSVFVLLDLAPPCSVLIQMRTGQVL